MTDEPGTLSHEELNALANLSDAIGISCSDLDALVDARKTEEATVINEQGERAQLAYLCEGMTIREALDFLIQQRWGS